VELKIGVHDCSIQYLSKYPPLAVYIETSDMPESNLMAMLDMKTLFIASTLNMNVFGE